MFEPDFQDQFLTPETAQDQDSRQCQRADDEDIAYKRHFPSQPAHAPQVTRPDAVDDRACSQEQKRFEDGMAEPMELAGEHAARANGVHHISKLADS
jgi:hypothetical protein